MGNPRVESFSTALAQSYQEGAKESGAEVEYINLSELSFDPILHDGYAKIQDLEPDLILVQEKIKWADHLVFVYPTWWGTMPALMKGFLDRAILPSFGYRFKREANIIDKFLFGWDFKGPSTMWDKLLTGKTARVITTTGSPAIGFWFLFGYAGHKVFKKIVLEFCGIKPVRISMFGSAEKASEKTHQKWLAKVKSLGRKMK